MKIYQILFSVLSILFIFSCNENPPNIPDDNNNIPPQSNDSLYVNLYNVPKYAKNDSLKFNGKIKNYSFIICEGGEKIVKQKINDSTFSFWYTFKKNTLNKLIVYAQDNYNRNSDTIVFSIIHDNIPPKMLFSSIQQNEKSVPIDRAIKFIMDESISSISAQFLLSTISSDFQYSYYPDRKTIGITTYQFLAGLEYPLRIIFSDSASNYLDTTIVFRTYYEKIDLLNSSSSLVKMFLSSDGSTLYLAQTNPNALLVYDVSTLSLKKNIPIPFLIKDATYNPYNGKVYIASFEESRVICVDPSGGQVLRNIPLIETGNPVYTPKHPISIAFASNGVGIVTALPLSASGPFSVQVIDSRDNDSIYVHPFYSPETFNWFIAYSFNNNSHLALVEQQGNGIFSIYDPVANTFTEYFGRQAQHSVRGNRKNNLLAIYGNEGIYLFNSLGNIVNHSPSNAILGRQFDFTYLNGEEYSIYVIYDKNIWVVDLLQNTMSSQAGLYGYSYDFFVTPDGKYIIDYQPPNILFIEPSTFRR